MSYEYLRVIEPLRKSWCKKINSYFCLRDIVCMVVIYVMREDVKYEGTHTYIGDRAKIFDQYG